MVKFTLYDAKHDAQEQFGRNKRQKTSSVQTGTGVIPLYERHDQLLNSASSVNSGLDFNVTLRPVQDDTISSMDRNVLQYQLAAANYRGGRLIRSDDFTYKYSKRRYAVPGSKHFKIDEDHYKNVRAEAEYGYRAVDGSVKMALHNQKLKTAGAMQHTRHRGYEQYANPRKYPDIPKGAPLATEPNLPNNDVFRFNDSALDQITQFPQNVF